MCVHAPCLGPGTGPLTGWGYLENNKLSFPHLSSDISSEQQPAGPSLLPYEPVQPLSYEHHSKGWRAERGWSGGSGEAVKDDDLGKGHSHLLTFRSPRILT